MTSRQLSRRELLAWVNTFLESDYVKLEDLADGIAYAQIFDAMYPGKFPLKKISFAPKRRDEMVRNFSVVQAFLDKIGVKKSLPIDALVLGRLQDHLSVLQWCYVALNRTYPDAVNRYSAHQRRLAVCQAQGREVTNPNLMPQQATALLGPSYVDMSSQSLSQSPERRRRTQPLHTPPRSPAGASAQLNIDNTELVDHKVGMARRLELERLVQSLESELTDLAKSQLAMRDDVDELRAERNFYYDKLRSIETLCDLHPDSNAAQELLAILTKTSPAFDE